MLRYGSRRLFWLRAEIVSARVDAPITRIRTKGRFVMRERQALNATASAMVLALLLSASARAQQENPTAGARNAAAGQNRNEAGAQTETIHGVIAAITAEGEVFYDHRTSSAAKSEATFLTVVGSPVNAEASDRDRDRRADASSNERHSKADRKRHNVYIAWLTPRTKICEAPADTDKANQDQNRGKRESQSSIGNKEVALDQLEVGDHVEIQFNRGEESGANSGVHQTQQMRQKHGRHRTFVGFATAITILPSREHNQAGTRGESNPTGRSQ
jgi:hypothetical protein